MESVDIKKTGIEYWKKVVVVLCLGWVTIWIYRTFLNPLFPLLKEEFGITSDATIGLISSTYFLGYTAMQIPSGYMADKIGRKKVMIPGFLVMALGPIFIGVSPAFSLIITASLLAGIGSGVYYGTAYSTSSASVPEEKRGISTAIINSGSAVGMIIGMTASSYFVLQAGISWRTMAFIVAGLIILMALVFWKVLKETAKTKAQRQAEAANVKEEDKVSLAKLLKDKQVLASYFLYFSTCYAYYMMVTWLPAFLQQERGFEGAAIGVAASMLPLAAIPGALIFSHFSDKYRGFKLRFIFTLELLVVGVIFLIVTVSSNWLLVGMLILYGLLGKLAVEPILISYMADNAPKEGYGTFFGFFNFFGMLSSVLAPVLTGLISDMTGSRVISFYFSAIILLLAVLFMFLATRGKKAASAN